MSRTARTRSRTLAMARLALPALGPDLVTSRRRRARSGRRRFPHLGRRALASTNSRIGKVKAGIHKSSPNIDVVRSTSATDRQSVVSVLEFVAILARIGQQSVTGVLNELR